MQKGSVELILLDLQSNSTGSVLINDGMLGAGIKELKPGAAAPTLALSLLRSSIDDLVFSVFLSNFVKLSYKISLIKNRFVTLFFIRFL